MHLRQLKTIFATMNVKLLLLTLSAFVLTTIAAAELPHMVGSKSRETTTPDPDVEEHTDEVDSTQDPEEVRCDAMIGKIVDDKFIGLEVKYDLAAILEKYGGAPGKVNTTWTEKEDAPVGKTDLNKRPLSDADEKFWIYKYGDTDFKTYIRSEHAVHRFRGTPNAFLDIRGVLYWNPDDFCGKSRRALYTVDDRGFNFQVSVQYCDISPTYVNCVSPPTCTSGKDGTTFYCIAAPSSALLASLIG